MTTTVTQPEARAVSPLTLRLALLVSLAVNLLGVGIIAGAILRGPPNGPPRSEFGLKSFSNTLPDDRSQMLRSHFQTHRPAVMDFRASASDARLEVIDILAVEPFDSAKLRGALDRLNEAEGKGRERMASFFLEIAEKLTPQERVALADWWRKHRIKRSSDTPRDKDRPGRD